MLPAEVAAGPAGHTHGVPARLSHKQQRACRLSQPVYSNCSWWCDCADGPTLAAEVHHTLGLVVFGTASKPAL